MKISFVYEDVKYTHVLKNKIIKIYSVPKEYSEDGIFISDYSKSMYEPMPESSSLYTTLLYHGVYRNATDQEYMDEVINNIGEVIYAKD